MTTTPILSQLGDEDFVELTTFRRSGVPVGTTVWAVRDGDDLLVTTPAGSGKVKRVQNNGNVELRPSTRLGRVQGGTPSVAATAELDPDPQAQNRATPLFLAKYGWQYRVAMVAESVLQRLRPKPGPTRRIVRIYAAR